MKDRVAFSSRLADLQSVTFRIADMETSLQRLIVGRHLLEERR